MTAVFFYLIEDYNTGIVTAYPCSATDSDKRTIVGVHITPWDRRVEVTLGHFNTLFSPVSFEFLVNVLFHTFSIAELLVLFDSSTWRVLLYTWRRDLVPEPKPKFRFRPKPKLIFRRRYRCIG